MTTNILALPCDNAGIQATFATSQDGEWYDPFQLGVSQNNGGTITTSWFDFTGIAFTVHLRSSGGKVVRTLSTTDGSFLNGGQQLAPNLSATAMAGLLPDTYTGHIVATADGHTRVVGQITLVHSASD